MKKLLLFLMLIPFLGFPQSVNEVDANGLKQGVWVKTFDNGNLRYKGQQQLIFSIKMESLKQQGFMLMN
jgi:hypothetical protein